MHLLQKMWDREGGYREVLILAVPLIISTASWTIQHFVDRMFLTWHSPEAIAASVPSGIMNFTILSLFLGTTTYVSTFIAQYYGAGRHDRIGPSLWQGVYLAIIAGIVHLFLIPLAEPIFALIGHEELVQRYETIYFQVLCLGAAPFIAGSALSSFYTGRGKTKVIMWVNIMATAVNLFLDYSLIFGNLGFPKLGVKGAAIATVLSSCFSTLAYIVLLSRRSYEKRYHIRSGWMLDKELFTRLMRYGFPNGIQFFLDIAGFTIFILLIGRIGTNELAATNIAFNINYLAFMPMLGLGMTISILVGQYIGKDMPAIAERCAYSGFHLSFLYILCIVTAYLVVPDVFISPFASGADKENFVPIREMILILIRFIAIYSLFDTLNIIFSSAIKGAGDTRFVMYMIITVSSLVLVIPSYIALVILKESIYVGWTIVSVYIIILSLAFYLRFKSGKWKSMRVIEDGQQMSTSLPETQITNL